MDGSNAALKDILIYDNVPMIGCSVYTAWLTDSSDLVTKHKQLVRSGDPGTRVSMDQFQEDLGNNASVSTRVAPMLRSEPLQIQAAEAPHSAGSEGGADSEDTDLLGST